MLCSSFRSNKTVFKLFLIVINSELVRFLILTHYRLQLEKAQFEWKHFTISLQRLLAYESIGTLHPNNVSLAIAEVITLRKHSYFSLLKGKIASIRLMHANDVKHVYEGTNSSLLTHFTNLYLKWPTFFKIKYKNKIMTLIIWMLGKLLSKLKKNSNLRPFKFILKKTHH